MPTLASSTGTNSLLLFVVEAVSSWDGDTATCAEVCHQATVTASVAQATAITTTTLDSSSRNNNTTKPTATPTPTTTAATKTNAATTTLLHKLVALNVRQCYLI